MPVVLFSEEGGDTSGNNYDDRTGISYEYPAKYSKWMLTGEPFVYHFRGQGYVGAGIVGAIAPSATTGRFVCEILDYRAFDEHVSLKDPDGFYYEAKPGVPAPYWSQGVRPLSTAGYEQIVWSSPPQSAASNFGVSGYASAEVAVMVESVSVEATVSWLKSEFPDETLVVMPHNNPGYDIRVGTAEDPRFFVEVKGTQSSIAVFWMSEGERKFSVANAGRYMIVVVSGINLAAKNEPHLTIRYGALEGSDVLLEASQWRGKILQA